MVGRGRTARHPLTTTVAGEILVMRQRPFSLVEMMVVMFLVMLIITMALTSFRQWTNGSQVNSAATEIGSLALQCRELAAARRTYVALIMPGPVVCTGVPDDRRYVYARPAYVTLSGTTFTFSSWVDATKWTEIGRGVTIMEADSDMGLSDGTNFRRTPQEDNASTVNAVEMNALGGTGTANGVRAVVFTPTGRLKYNYSMNITVGEATYMGAWIIKHPARIKTTSPAAITDIGPANQVTVLINRFTGNISYVAAADYLSGGVIQ